MNKILLLNGPNLNLLGTREPEIYGSTRLIEIEQKLSHQAAKIGYDLSCLQSNAEQALIERIHQAKHEGVVFIIINPAGLTHTSVILRDALLSTAIPFIEIHISNVFKREKFRHFSYLADIAVGTLCGFDAYGYELALLAAHHYLTQTKR